jgi:hypothetical protein
VTGTLFVDIDNTLLVPGRFSRTLWRLAKFFQNLGRAGQRPNPAVLDTMTHYKQVILVTSRDVSDRERTLRLLSKYGIRISEARFCPRQVIFGDWKRRLIEESAPEGPVAWMDDIFDQSGPVILRRGSEGREIQGLPVPGLSVGCGAAVSEPPSL